MVERGESGQLKPGSVLNPKGRPKKTDEDKYMSVVFAVANQYRFQAALEKQMRKAENGDLESFKYICKLLGLEIDRKQLTGKDGDTLTIKITGNLPDDEV